MPFEVFPVEGPDTKLKNSETFRSADKVADNIQDIYNDVATMGGKIIAAHTLSIPRDESFGVGEEKLLFLVAEIPELAEFADE